MSDDPGTFERAGRRLAGLIGEGPGTDDIEDQWSAILASSQGNRRRKTRVRTFTLVAAVLVVAGVLAYVVMPRETHMRFWIGGEVVEGSTGAWVRSVEGTPLGSSFSDGSNIRLANGAYGRVVDSTLREVHVQLENGSLYADIRSAGRTSWSFTAGPYRIRVTGTAFTMNWDAAASVLDLSVTRGTVVVHGIADRPSGVALGAGESFRTADGKPAGGANEARNQDSAGSPLPSRQVSIETSAGKMAKDRLVSSAKRDPKPEPGGQPSPQAVPSTVAQTATLPAWIGLYEQGRYREAFDTAVAGGYEAILGSLDADGLWALAESARYSLETEKARSLLSALRSRFPGSGRAKTATFLLGRLAVEFDQHPDEGARWFSVYLEELPDGPLAEEAAGRSIDALQKAGRHAEARTAAGEYLRKYPKGNFAGLARSFFLE
jgi:hypothetical protein